MRRAVVAVLALTLFAPSLLAQLQRPKPSEFAHTFSIVARDPQTGEMGAAVQSHWFSVGSIVTWAEAGVGAIATQSFVQPSYGRDGLELMRKGTTAPHALQELLKADTSRNVRQVAFVDAQGRAAVWTGSHCVASAGDIVGGTTNDSQKVDGAPDDGVIHIGENYTVEANMMINEKIWPAMDKAFRESKGDLADRMLAALDAAQAAGGDARGRQSAAIVVVKAKPSGKSWEDRIFDLRVEDHSSPLVELRRLVGIARAYNHMNAGDLAVEHKDNEAALREYSAAEQLVQSLQGVDKSRVAEMSFWHAQALVQMGRVDESLPLFKKAFQLHPSWVVMVPRVQKAGLLPNDQKVLDKILAQAPKGANAAKNRKDLRK
jgi:uncharacterized Ntn-hydrolase superfamily protein